MNWFIRSRLRPLALIPVIALVAICAIAGDARVPTPNFTSGAPLVLSVAMLGPALIAAALASILAVGHEREWISPRPMGHVDRALAITTTTVCGAPLFLDWLITGSADAAIAGRDLLGYLGIILIVRRSGLGTAVAAAPVAVAVVLSVLSSIEGSVVFGWPSRGADDGAALAINVALWVVGVAIGTGRSALRASVPRE